MAKLKIQLEERFRALDLLKEGHDVDSAVAHLHENYHPDWNIEDVRKVYFPHDGIYAISKLVGRPISEIDARLVQMRKTREAFQKSGAVKLKNLMDDPNFARANSRRAKRLMEDLNAKGLNKGNPRASEAMLENRQDPVFEEQRLKNLAMQSRKLVISIEDRLRALELLKQGYTAYNVARYLRENHHPDFSVKKVKTKYFPATGIMRISHMEGKTPEEIDAFTKEFLIKVQKFADLNREKIKKQHADPNFHEAAMNAGRDTLKRLNKKPYFVAKVSAAAADLLKTQRRNPLFNAALNEARLKKFEEDADFREAHAARSRVVLGKLRQDPDFERVRKQSFDALIDALRRGRPNFKVQLDMRRAGLELLRNGFTIDGAARKLRDANHPDRSVYEVKQAYFPTSGDLKVTHLITAPVSEVDTFFEKLRRRRVKTAGRNYERTHGLIRTASTSSFENGAPVMVDNSNPHDDLEHVERVSLINQALRSLDPLDAHIIRTRFDLPVVNPELNADVSSLSSRQVRARMEKALHSLSSNSTLFELLSGNE